MKKISHKSYMLLLGVIFFFVWLILAIKPLYRKDWFMENVLVFVFVFIIVATFKKFPLSRVSITFIFIFLCLHEIGAHYTYSEVPFNLWSETLFGKSINSLFGWERNNFDRVIHFLYGVLLCYPIREIYLQIANVKGFWGYFLPLDFTMLTSMLYELFEWATAEIFGGDLGVAYLGTQGDVFDAQKDMLLATTGALISMTITATINYPIKRDYTAEWIESFVSERKKNTWRKRNNRREKKEKTILRKN